eukprot:jgi/Tetstr1/427296/TSEL_017465.t1
MGVGEDPVGEDSIDIDAPAWPPADVEAADEGVIRKGDPFGFYMNVIAKKFRGVWHYGVIIGVVTEWVLEDYGGATQWRAVFEDGDIVDLLRSEVVEAMAAAQEHPPVDADGEARLVTVHEGDDLSRSGKVTVQFGWVMEDCLHHMETFSIVYAGPLFEEARVKAIMTEKELASPAVVRSGSRLAVLGHMYKRMQGAAWFVTRWGLQNVVTEEDGPERKAQVDALTREGRTRYPTRRQGAAAGAARRQGAAAGAARRQGEWDGRGSGCYRCSGQHGDEQVGMSRRWLRGGWRERSLARLNNPLSPNSRLDHGLLRLLTRRTRRIIVAWQGVPPPATAPSAVADAVVAGCCEEVALDIAPWPTSPHGQKWAASLVVSRVRAAGIEEDEKDMRKRVTRGRPDAKVRKLMAASSTAQPPGVVKTLTDDKKRKRPVTKRRGKKLTVAESEAQAEAEAEAARSSKRRVPRARKNKNKQ